MSQPEKLWREKYRPTKIEEYIFQSEQEKKILLDLIKRGSIRHTMFSGVPGTGKSTLARLLVQELNLDPMDVMVVKASDENNVEVMREKIKGFITTYAMGDYKVVILEEADRITGAGQDILRHFLEDYDDNVRFILTCNHAFKIIPAIRSRCEEYQFKAHNKDDIAEMMANILLKENVKFELELLDEFIDMAYPDVRKIIGLLQKYSVGGALQIPNAIESIGADFQNELIALIEKDKWWEVRKLLCENVATEEWESVYRYLYDNLDKCPKFKDSKKWENGIVIIAEYLHKHSMVADPEINFAACAIKLGQA